MRRKANQFWFGLTVLFVSSAGLWGMGCGAGEQFSSLQQFKTCDGLLNYLKDRAKDEARKRYGSSWSGGRSFFPSAGRNVMAAGSSGPFGAVGAPAARENTSNSKGDNSGYGSSAPPRDYSKTNNQVTGVDEADIIKNDGTYLYVLNRNYFLVVKAWPASEMKLVGQYKMNATPQEMFVYKDKVVIFTRSSGNSKVWPSSSSSWSRHVYNQVTRMTVLDIKDKSKPSLIREILSEGEYKTARRIDSMVRVVLYSRMDGPRFSYNYYGGGTPWESERLRDEQLDKHMKTIEQTKLADWLPRVNTTSFDGGKELARKEYMLSNCQSFYRPSVNSGRGIISVYSIQIDKPNADLKHATLVSNYGLTYASGKALYIATQATSRNNFSHIHKFDISQVGKPAIYIASGGVSGGILNQFALDEYQNHLRVATTSREGFGTENNVYVLKQNGNKLDVVGSVRGLARGERIFSVRFLQDRGFIVTFRQVDPLFTLDLSSPTAPRAVGELKIPGFSTYIHPLDRDHLLTIGVDGDGRGTNGKIQLAIFDVTQFDRPKQAHKLSISASQWSGSSSAALYDHKAFNYFAARKVLAIPASTYNYRYKSGGEGYFVGVQLFNIDIKKGISFRGQVSHTDLYKNYKGKTSPDGSSSPQMRRSAFIEDYFFSISFAGMKVHHIDKLSAGISTVIFPL